MLLTHCRLFSLKSCFHAWISVTLLDTRTAPGELKWAASPSEGGVSGSSFFFYRDTVYNQFSLLEKVTPSLTHTLGLETVMNHPTYFEMCLLLSLSAYRRMLALCLAHEKADTSLVVGVIFLKDF